MSAPFFRPFFHCALLAAALSACAQARSPAIQTAAVWIAPQPNTQPVQLTHVSIDTVANGLAASSRIEMQFYNPNNRVLEGEFIWPLSAQQSVVGYALEVQGAMREGVVVPKELARVAFEEITRQGIDPGLAELTRGNVFRTRLYPIPARGVKRIAIVIDQSLLGSGSKRSFELPIPIAQRLEEFRVRVSLDGKVLRDTRIKNAMPETRVKLDVPGGPERLGFAVAGDTGYWLQHVSEPAELASKANTKASALTVFWDASRSGLARDQARELQFLRARVLELQPAKLSLVVMRNAQEAPRTFAHVDALISAIKATPFDGGSALMSANFSSTSDWNLLFTDGDSNFDPYRAQLVRGDTGRFVIVHATAQPNPRGLRQLGQRLSASIIDLSSVEAIKEKDAFYEAKTAVDAQVIAGACAEAPIMRLSSELRWTLSARCAAGARVQVKWQRGERRFSQTLEAPASQLLSGADSALLMRQFGAQRIAHAIDAGDADKSVQAIAVRFGVVTEWTSLLVLDRIEDYVRFGVQPKEPELRKLYAHMIEQSAIAIGDGQPHLALLGEWQAFQAFHARWRNRYRATGRYFVNNFAIEAMSNKAFEKRANALLEEWRAMEMSKMHSDAQESMAKALFLRAQALEAAFVKTLTPTEREARAAARAVARQRQLLQPVQVSTAVNARADSRDDRPQMSAPMAESAAAPAPAPEPAAEELDEVALTGSRMRNREADDGVVLDVLAAGAGGETKSVVELKAYQRDSTILRELRTAKDPYQTYLAAARQDGSIGFFIDCADFFQIERKQPELALRVLSNIAEVQVESVAAIRILAEKLRQLEYLPHSLAQFEIAYQLRPEEPQGARDFALTLAQAGQFVRAQQLLWTVASGDWHPRFKSIALTALHEFNEVYARAPLSERVSLQAMGIDPELIKPEPLGLRVVLGWNTDNVDMDLWVLDPAGDWAFYSQRESLIGGLMSDDFTQGYGPETFTIKNPIPGRYRVFVNFYGDHQQLASAPIQVYLSFFTNFGAGKAQQTSSIRTLESGKEVQEIGSFEVK